LPVSGTDSKTVVNVMAGVTQIITRNWLMQLNYNYGSSQGYQTDPYTFITLFNSAGRISDYLYENRPRSRTKQSIYWGNKFAVGTAVTDFSLRYYTDSWDIRSVTAELAERIGITRSFYIEPSVRYYQQTAANFFQPYLVGSLTSVPTYASADSRLDDFSALTYSGKLGMRLTDQTELWLAVDSYKQKGRRTLTNAPAQVVPEKAFGGISAYSVMLGFKYLM
jgi:hypothetical protein